MDQAHSVEEIHDPDIRPLGTVIRLLVSWELEVEPLRNFFLADPVSEALWTCVRVGILIQPVACVRLFSAMGGFRPRPATSATTATLARGGDGDPCGGFLCLLLPLAESSLASLLLSP